MIGNLSDDTRCFLVRECASYAGGTTCFEPRPEAEPRRRAAARALFDADPRRPALARELLYISPYLNIRVYLVAVGPSRRRAWIRGHWMLLEALGPSWSGGGPKARRSQILGHWGNVCNMPQVVSNKYDLRHARCMPQVVPIGYHLRRVVIMPNVLANKFPLEARRQYASSGAECMCVWISCYAFRGSLEDSVEASWGQFWGIVFCGFLGAAWGVLEASWRAWGHLGALLGPPGVSGGEPLDCFNCFDALLGPSWRRH